MKATRLLESQHREVESLIRQLRSRTVDRETALTQLADSLAAHMLIEEEIFYPVASITQGAAILQNYEEHQVEVPVVERLVVTCDSDAFDARLTVLAELIRKHVGEEENALFPAMDRLLAMEQNEMLGAQMEARFQEVLPLGFRQILALRPIPTGMAGEPCPPPAAPPPQQRKARKTGQGARRGGKGPAG